MILPEELLVAGGDDGEVTTSRVRDRTLVAVHMSNGVVSRAAALIESYESTAAPLITA